MNFMIVRSLSPYNGIIGRPGIREIQAVPSTAHEMLKFLVDGGIVTICSTILIPAECATVITSSKEIPKEAGVRHENFKVALHPNFPDQEPLDMTVVPRSIAEHQLNIREGYSPVRQKKRGQAPECAKDIQTGIVTPFQKSTGKLNLSVATPLSVSWTLRKAITRYRWQSQMKRKRLSTPAMRRGTSLEATKAALVRATPAGSTQIERGTDCIHGPELNYTPMEKLVLSLVFAAKRYDYKNGASCWENTISQTGQRTSVKGQILADFLVEKPDESPPDTSVDGDPTSGLLLTKPEGTEKDTFQKIKGRQANSVMSRPDSTNWGRGFLQAVGNRHSWSIPGGTRKGQIFDSRYGLFHKVDRGESRVDNHWQSGEEVHVGQHIKHPQSNGLVERANRSLGDRIKARLGEGNKNWIEELPHVLWAHRTTIKSSHGDTPFSLTYGTEAVIPAEIGMPTYRTTAVDAVHNDEELRLNLDLLEERRERAAIREAKAKLQMTKYYNGRVRGVTFRPGDFVYCSNDASHAVGGGKLGPK
ncbi:reverse transcriptase domain-containing protein [Tanacetum coccineum]